MASYKVECPKCPSNNFYITEHNGVGYCFSCGYYENSNNKTPKTNTQSKHIEDIRALYTQLAHYYHTSLDTRTIQYLHMRGFTDETIQKYKIGYCPVGKAPFYKSSIAIEAGIATQDKQALLGDRIIFPYFIDDTTITDMRGRTINPDEELRYKSPFGSSYYRGAIYPYNYTAYIDAQTVLITEGEIKAAIANQYGFTTIALPGIRSWREGFREKRNKRHILVFDNQREHTRQLHDAIRKIARNIHTLEIATLPLFGKDKQDIDSFILEYGIDRFSMIIHAAVDYHTWESVQR